MRNGVKRCLLVLCSLGLLFAFDSALAKAYNSPVGYWNQIDDATKKVHSIIRITKAKNGTLQGKIMGGFKLNGKMPKVYCTGCPKPFTNKHMLDITLLWGFKYDPQNHKWEGGRILDPDGGSVYRCTMALFNGGKSLKVRGYIGISLFGRTQVWQRIPPSRVKSSVAKSIRR
jgi:uncharacterized protein (DUF2147 family)